MSFHEQMQANQISDLSTRIAKTCLAFRDEVEAPVDILMFGSVQSLAILIARCTTSRDEALSYIDAAKMLLDHHSKDLLALSFNEDGSKKKT